jgi:integrase
MIFEAYETEMRLKRNGASTWRNYTHTRDRFLRWCQAAGLTPEKVGHREMMTYFAGMESLAPSTVHRHWRTLHAAYRRAASPKYRYIEVDPTEGMPLPPIRQTRPFAFSAGDLRAIKAEITRPQDWLAFHILAYTGMRSVELRRLAWADVNLKTNILRITGKQTRRGNDERDIPIHPVLRTVLLEANYHLGQYVLPGRKSGRTGEMLSETQVAFYIRRNVPASVYRPKGDTCHPIRRAVASNLRRNGVDTDTIDKLLGWAPTSLRAQRYMAFENDDLQGAIVKLWADDPL